MRSSIQLRNPDLHWPTISLSISCHVTFIFPYLFFHSVSYTLLEKEGNSTMWRKFWENKVPYCTHYYYYRAIETESFRRNSEEMIHEGMLKIMLLFWFCLLRTLESPLWISNVVQIFIYKNSKSVFFFNSEI